MVEGSTRKIFTHVSPSMFVLSTPFTIVKNANHSKDIQFNLLNYDRNIPSSNIVNKITNNSLKEFSNVDTQYKRSIEGGVVLVSFK